MKKIFKKEIIISAVFVFIIFIGWFFLFPKNHSYENKTGEIMIKNKKFQVEIVSNRKEMEKGLGGRENLCDSCGMLFEFSSPEKHSFWMKGMNFPLDIIWILDNKIVHIEKNVSEKFSGIIFPKTNADKVLELNAGIIDKIGAKVGNDVIFLY